MDLTENGLRILAIHLEGIRRIKESDYLTEEEKKWHTDLCIKNYYQGLFDPKMLQNEEITLLIEKSASNLKDEQSMQTIEEKKSIVRADLNNVVNENVSQLETIEETENSSKDVKEKKLKSVKGDLNKLNQQKKSQSETVDQIIVFGPEKPLEKNTDQTDPKEDELKQKKHSTLFKCKNKSEEHNDIPGEKTSDS
ncbi:unnamed protein product, partial [Brachionus calyciflorus]